MLIIALYLPKVIREDKILSQPDTRNIALHWIRGHVPAGAKILRFPNTPEFRKNDPYRVTVDWEGKLVSSPASVFRDYDYFVVSAFPAVAHLDKAAVVIAEFSGTPVGEFHNPTVRIYKKK